MLTPFKDDQLVDYTCLEQLTEFYISAGSNGLFVNCLSGEMFRLTDEERVRITKTVVRKAGGRVPVVSTGTFGADIKRNSDLIKKIYDTGVQAVIVNSNQLVERSGPEDALKGAIEKLLNTTGTIPLGMYECPVPYKRLISPELMNWLGQTDRFHFHKDTSCDADVIRSKVMATEGSMLNIYNENTPTGLLSLYSGASGMAPIGANFFPELYSCMIENMDKDKEKAGKINMLLTLLDETTDNSYYPLSAKIFLKIRGLDMKPIVRRTDLTPSRPDVLKLNAMLDLVKDFAHGLVIPLVNLS